MNGISTPRLLAIAAVALLSAAAATPSILSKAEAGEWEISRNGGPSQRLCIADAAVLAQFEDRSARCTREVIRDSDSTATVHYSCVGGDFGQSDITLLTPRSLRVQTQGISSGAPFKYTFQARRMGACPAH